MNLTFASVLSCTENGCKVLPINAYEPVETKFSQKVVDHSIPIHPNQFVIVNHDPSPPQTIFRFRRATIMKIDDEQIEVEGNGERLTARRSSTLHDDLSVGMDVVLKGHDAESRRVIDVVIDGKPSRIAELEEEWFPLMGHYK